MVTVDAKIRVTKEFISRMSEVTGLDFMVVFDIVWELKLPYFFTVEEFYRLEPWFDVIFNYFSVSRLEASERIKKKYASDPLVSDLLL